MTYLAVDWRQKDIWLLPIRVPQHKPSHQFFVNPPAEISGQTNAPPCDSPNSPALQKQTQRAARGGLIEQIRHHHFEFLFHGRGLC